MFGFGESMGGAQLLQALPKEPRFCAVVAESPFATFREVAYARFGRPFHTGPWIGRTLFRPAADVGFLYVRYSYGLNLEAASPQQAVVGIQDSCAPHPRPERSQHASLPFGPHPAKNPSEIAVWKVPGATHTQALQAAPQEFERTVLRWFAEHSSPALPTSGSENLNFTSPHSQYCPVSSARPRSRAQA
jgi:hypothetical protein